MIINYLIILLENKIYHGPVILQSPGYYVPHPMHDIIVTVIASALNMTLHSI